MSPTLVLKLLRGEGLEYYNNSEWFRRDFIAADVSVDDQRRDQILADRRLHLICRLLDQIDIKMKVVKEPSEVGDSWEFDVYEFDRTQFSLVRGGYGRAAERISIVGDIIPQNGRIDDLGDATD